MSMNDEQRIEAMRGWLAQLQEPTTALMVALLCANTALELREYDLAMRMLDRTIEAMSALHNVGPAPGAIERAGVVV